MPLLLQVPVTRLQVASDAWLQVVWVTHADSKNVTLYDHEKNQLDLVLPHVLTSFTVDVNAVVLRGKGSLQPIAVLSFVPVKHISDIYVVLLCIVNHFGMVHARSLSFYLEYKKKITNKIQTNIDCFPAHATSFFFLQVFSFFLFLF